MSPALDFLCPRPRNKLRKLHKRRPDSTVSNVSPRGSTDWTRDAGEAHGKLTPKSPSHRASLSAPPDLSDPKWQDYVRKGGLLQPLEQSPHLAHAATPTPPSPIPEFVHLAVAPGARAAAPPSQFAGEPLTPAPHSPHSPRSTLSSSSSSIRKYAKTPVLRIGQLEGEPSCGNKPADRASDVETIAEQYRALLGARSGENLSTHDTMEEKADDWHAARTRRLTVDTIRSAVSRRSPLPPSPPLHAKARQLTVPVRDPEPDGGSPTSDGTLVEFEEDAIYFKPAFSPDALSPIPEDEDALSGPAASLLRQPEALSLQIAMELLTKQLAGTLRHNRPRRQSVTETPSLQTWLMIEAYETLRDQVLEMALPTAEAHALHNMFAVWLSALYRLHEGLVDDRDLARARRASSELSVDSLRTDSREGRRASCWSSIL